MINKLRKANLMDTFTFKLKKKKKTKHHRFPQKILLCFYQQNQPLLQLGEGNCQKTKEIDGGNEKRPESNKEPKTQLRKKIERKKELNWRESERWKGTMRDAIVTRGSAIATRGSTPSPIVNHAFLRSVAAATRHFFLGFGGQNDAYQWLTIDADRYI